MAPMTVEAVFGSEVVTVRRERVRIRPATAERAKWEAMAGLKVWKSLGEVGRDFSLRGLKCGVGKSEVVTNRLVEAFWREIEGRNAQCVFVCVFESVVLVTEGSWGRIVCDELLHGYWISTNFFYS